MSRRRRKKGPRWREKPKRRDTGLRPIRKMSWYFITRPPEGVPGFLMAILPFVLLGGLVWHSPGFWQFPLLAAILVVLGLVVLKIDWPRNVKTIFAVAAVTASVLAFVLSGTEVGPFVLPVLGAGWLLSFWRRRALERDSRERDSWRRR